MWRRKILNLLNDDDEEEEEEEDDDDDDVRGTVTNKKIRSIEKQTPNFQL